MATHDTTVKRAEKLTPGDLLVGVDARGEHLHRVVTVRDGKAAPDTWPPLLRHGFVTVIMEGGRRANLGKRAPVRVAHPDYRDEGGR